MQLLFFYFSILLFIQFIILMYLKTFTSKKKVVLDATKYNPYLYLIPKLIRMMILYKSYLIKSMASMILG